MMKKLPNSADQEESLANKWADLVQYEKHNQEETTASKWADLMQHEKQVESVPSGIEEVQGGETNTKFEKLKRLKQSTSAQFSLMRNQISGLYR